MSSHKEKYPILNNKTQQKISSMSLSESSASFICLISNAYVYLSRTHCAQIHANIYRVYIYRERFQIISLCINQTALIVRLQLKIDMNWYSGDIGAAIAESKRKLLIFLVYVYGSCKEISSYFACFLSFTLY